MLLELENTNQSGLNLLLQFAKENSLQLSVVGSENSDNYALPGKPLTPEQLEKIIEDSRNEPTYSAEEVRDYIQGLYEI